MSSMLLAKEATAQTQEGMIILDVTKIDLVQQNCSSLAIVSSLEHRGHF